MILNSIRAAIGLCASAMGIVFYAIFLVSLLVGALVGAWDLLVWLINADWKNTHFAIPSYAFLIGAPSLLFWYVLEHGIAHALLRNTKNSN